MKRLCLMALSLLMLSFNAFAQISVNLVPGQWNFIGFGAATTIEEALADADPMISEDNKLWALSFNYQNESWNGNYLRYDSEIAVGDGVFVCVQTNTTLGLEPATGEVQISRTIYPFELPPWMRTSKAPELVRGRAWVALSNPFNIEMSAELFFHYIQISSSYRWFNIMPDWNENALLYTYDGISWDNPMTIAPGQGFFIDLDCAGGATNDGIEINFSLSEEWADEPIAKNSSEREYVSVSVATDGYKVPVRLAQNSMATDEFDICDARKMFGSGSVAEPYLVCNGINLCKEEVNSENYTATMNIKSFESRSVEIVADNIPEGYSLTLIDGAVEVEMSEGDVYTTDITEGENAERFKLLITKNNVSIADVAETESVRVVNNNRSIAIYGGKNVRTEVYNALGQKVYETSDRAFDLNNVASGAYVLRVQDGKSVNSTKIVVE